MKYFNVMNESFKRVYMEGSSDSKNEPLNPSFDYGDEVQLSDAELDSENSYEQSNMMDISIAGLIGRVLSAKVHKNVVYYITDYTYMSNTRHTNVLNGIMRIFEITNGWVKVHSPKHEHCKDIELIGKKDLNSYFSGGVIKTLSSVKSFIDWYSEVISQEFLGDTEDEEALEQLNTLIKEKNKVPFMEEVGDTNNDDVSLEPMSMDFIKAEIEKSGEDIYSILGDELFTTYSSILGDIESDTFNDLPYSVWNNSTVAREFLKSKSLEKFKDIVGEKTGTYLFEMSDKDIEHSSDMSPKFITACFEHEASYFFLGSYSSSDFDALEVFQFINEESFKEFSKFGFTREIILSCLKGEDNPLSEYSSELDYVLRRAAADAYGEGAAQSAEKRFEYSFESALPKGTSYIRDNHIGYRIIEITEEFVSAFYPSVFWYVSLSGWGFEDAIQKTFLELFNDKFNFYEPRYGFEGFDENYFNDALLSYLSVSEIADITKDDGEK